MDKNQEIVRDVFIAFLDKNKDQLSMDVVKLVTSTSTDDYIKNLFATDPKFLETAP